MLNGYPDWEIMFPADVPGEKEAWPATGLIIHDDEIIDDLQREILPEEFRNLVYGGSKRFSEITEGRLKRLRLD